MTCRNMVRKGLCACVKTWITCRSESVLLATDSNSTVLHFDSLNKLDACMNRSFTMSSINMDVLSIFCWVDNNVPANVTIATHVRQM